MAQPDYIIVDATTVLRLEELVDVELRRGYRCQGGVAVTVGPGAKELWLYQAMVKRPAAADSLAFEL